MDESQLLDTYAVLSEYVPADRDTDKTLELLAQFGEDVQALSAPFSFWFSSMGFHDSHPIIEFAHEDEPSIKMSYTWDLLYDVGPFDLAGMMCMKMAERVGDDPYLMCNN